MDRRSWLWRRKSSDKSSGETESLGSVSGSMSSPSERFSDDQQVYPIQSTQSPEIMSNHAEDTHDDNVKILSQKLSAAIAAVNEKEELVKQHAKVAEEAVTGWERAENEMNALKQQLEAATIRNSTLEDKVIHLDGALKECLRQLRQVREEQDQRVQETIAAKSENTESTSSHESDLRLNLVSIEKENESLQRELHSLLKQLEERTVERDLSVKRAETVSKQHLESIKRVSKLEAECRQLKAMASKGTSFNKSDTREADRLKPVKSSSSNVVFMDDFLEMEKLASSPAQKIRRSALESTQSIEERIEMVEAEKVELSLKLTQYEEKLKMSESSFQQLQAEFSDCQNQLKMSQAQLMDANKKMGVLQAKVDLAGELRQAIELELEDANARREDAEGKYNRVENERRNLLSKVAFLEGEVENERTAYTEALEKCRALENELSTMKSDSKSWQNQLDAMKGEVENKRKMHAEALEKCRALENELSRMKSNSKSWQKQLDAMKAAKEAVEREMKSTSAKTKSLETERMTVEAEVKSLLAKIESLENDCEKERRLSVEFKAKCRKLDNELSETRREADLWKSQLSSVNDLKEGVMRELQMEKTKKEEVERKLEAVQAEAEKLDHEMRKEKLLSAEFAAKCQKLEDELSKMRSAANIQFVPLSKEELTKLQEKELAVAASKLAECKKTIASLGNQLNSLATLEDLFSDSDNQHDISEKDSQLFGSDVEPATLHCNSISSETGAPEPDSLSVTSEAKEKEKEGLSSKVLDNSKYGIGNIFSRSRSSVRTRNSRG